VKARAAVGAAGLLLGLGAPAAAEPAGGAAPPALPGRALYVEHCAVCHGAEGGGDGPAGLAALPMPRDFRVGRFKFDADGDGRTGTDRDLLLVIRDGAGAVGGNPLMAPWGHLGEARLHELVAYVRSLERPRAPSPAARSRLQP
jgi:mono/diheme cytochrome c family protein